MLQGLFSGFKAKTFFAILVFALILWLPSFLGPDRILTDEVVRMPLSELVAGFSPDSGSGGKIIAFLLIIIQSYILFMLNGKFILINNRTFLHSFFYITIVSFHSSNLKLSPALLAAFFMIIAISMIFDSYSRDKNTYRFFEAGLILGIASFFYPRLIFFLPFIWVCAIILRPFYVREWFMPVVGVLLPFLLYTGVNFLLGNDISGFFFRLKESISSDFVPLSTSLSGYIFLGYLFLLITISSIYMLKVFQFKKVYIRKYYQAFFWLFIISVLIFVLMGMNDSGFFYFIAIPVSFILSNFFMTAKKTPGRRILFGVFLLILIFNSLDGIFSILPG